MEVGQRRLRELEGGGWRRVGGELGESWGRGHAADAVEESYNTVNTVNTVNMVGECNICLFILYTPPYTPRYTPYQVHGSRSR